MANWYTPTEEVLALWKSWLADHEEVRELAEQFPPWKLFKLNNQRVFVVGYEEHGAPCASCGKTGDGHGALKVAVTGMLNMVSLAREVNGVHPEELAECELPDPLDLVGCMLSEEQQALLFEEIKVVGIEHVSIEDFIKRHGISDEEIASRLTFFRDTEVGKA